ncbi:MAG TPA: methionyl-tRNA formyltransferase, partial [Chitinophagaceae bacterium]|nr:methionyl-tRNA formyltransferase [Chitinophagaceae bacterium]
MQAYPRIVFLGTPDFAVASLDALLAAGFNVVGVVTAPDKPAGRGMQLQQSAVKQFAVRHNIPVLQPEKLKNPDFLASLKALKADVQVVVAFRMLPEVVWNMPP